MRNRKGKFQRFDDFFDYEEELVASMSPMSRSAPVRHMMDSFAPKVMLQARNDMQKAYIQYLQNPEVPIVISTGAAGTGKTFVANAFGMEQLQAKNYEKIVLTRPMISVDENDLGALPGTLQMKMAPWTANVFDVLHKYVSPSQLQNLINKGTVEICPLSMMRGRSFENCYIIADEMQNATQTQMLMLLTRIGENSKLVINGDPMQHDRPSDTNGLSDLLVRLEQAPQNGIQVVHFTEEHVERHPIIKNVLRLYNRKY